ncbi:AMP-binding protein [Lentzea chajnantorensis]
MIEALRRCAELAPDTAVVFPGGPEHVTVAEVYTQAVTFATRLRQNGVRPGDVVGMLCSTGSQVLTGIFGVTAAGAAVSVLPTPPVMRDAERAGGRLTSLVRASGMRFLLADSDQRWLAALVRSQLPEVIVLDLPTGPIPAEDASDLPTPDSDDVAVIQYTSGSTSQPKGVVLRHRNILAGLRSISVSARITPDDVLVHWVPHFHDMGLFGWLACLLSGAATHTWNPAAFIRRPARFLQYFAEQGGTIMTGPNFAYDLILAAVDEETVSSLDLSRWRLAFNGAEPVSATTVAAFTDRFATALAGRHVMYPVYGMAEATLAISFPEPGDAPRKLSVNREKLGAGVVCPVHPDDQAAMPVVSVGRPVHGISVEVVAPDGEVLGAGAVGEIQIAGPGVSDGYDEPDENLFRGGRLRTGDLGFRYDGELYVAGRIKDMIIVKGENFFATDVEAVAREVPGVYRRRCVAVAGHGEELVVIAEVANRSAAERDGVSDRISATIRTELSLDNVRIELVDRGRIPRTTSGKWQRGQARTLIGSTS